MPRPFDKSRSTMTSWYAAFRGSPAFIVCLLLLESGWMLSHVLWNFDSDWGMLNLFLSTEASITTALLIIDLRKAELMQTRHLKYMLHLLEAICGPEVVAQEQGEAAQEELVESANDSPKD